MSTEEAFHIEAIVGYHLVRVGDVIHRSTCRHAKGPGANRWFYADKNPDADWAEHRNTYGCRPGVCCLPPSPWTDGVE